MAKSSGRSGAATGIVPTPVASPQRMRAEAGPLQRFGHYNREGTAQDGNSPCGRRRPFDLEGRATDFLVETQLFDRLPVVGLHPTSLLCAGEGGLCLTTSRSKTQTCSASEAACPRQQSITCPRDTRMIFNFDRALLSTSVRLLHTLAPSRPLTSRSAGLESCAILR